MNMPPSDLRVAASDAAAAPGFMLPARDHRLDVPPDEQLQLVRVAAKSAGNLRGLRQMVAAWEAVAEKCDLAFEEMVRLAVFRLEVERDLGAELAQTVSQGRPKKRSPEVTFSSSHELPDGVTKQQAAKYRALAAVPEAAFRAYVERSRDQRKLPSASGARRHAAPARAPHRSVPSRRARSSDTLELPASVIEAVGRVFTPDVCVGNAGAGASGRVAARTKNVFDELAGDVLVADCPEPGPWLEMLQRLRKKGQVRDAVVVLSAVTWESWFRALVMGGWTVCFVEGVRTWEGVGVVVAHAGTRHRAFRLVFTALGAIVSS